MKSSKFNKKSATSFFSFPEKKSYAIMHTVIPAAFILCLIFIFSFALPGCGSINKLSSVSSKTDIVNDNKEPEDTMQTLDDVEQTQDISNGAKSEDTETTESVQNTEETIPEEITEEKVTEEITEETDAIDPSPSTINVYYANSTEEYLVGEARTVEGSNKLVDAVYELMKDPIDPSLYVLVPPTTKINSIKVKDGLAKVDLSTHFLEDRFISDTVDILLKYAVVNTLTEFKEVNSVLFYIDGEKINTLGQLDIEDPIYRRSDLIKDQ